MSTAINSGARAQLASAASKAVETANQIALALAPLSPWALSMLVRLVFKYGFTFSMTQDPKDPRRVLLVLTHGKANGPAPEDLAALNAGEPPSYIKWSADGEPYGKFFEGLLQVVVQGMDSARLRQREVRHDRPDSPAG